MKSTILSLALVAQGLAFIQQQPLIDPFHPQLNGDFQIYSSDASFEHSISVKRQNASLCDTPVDQYTGWLNVGHHHLFFWYFAAQSSASVSSDKNDLPLALWLNGGPGASSMLGMLEELGPCLINDHGNETVNNPYGWNKDNALMFVDEPAGVGFSYLDEDAPAVTNSRVGMADMYLFLQMFITKVMPSHANGGLHLTGESYAGHYLPALGTEILFQNRMHPHRHQVPLKSIAMGNAYVSPQDTLFGHWETLCTTNPGVPEPVFNKTYCDLMATQLPACMEVFDVCVRNPITAVCAATEAVCGGISELFFKDAFKLGGRNPYDISVECEAPPFCYAEGPLIENYLNLPSTFKALGVPSAVKNYSMANLELGLGFSTTPDPYINYIGDVAALLTSGVDILAYQGNLDLACNTAGAKRWAARVAWDGQAEFTAKSLKPWSSVVKGKKKVVGEMKEVNIKVKGSEKSTRFAFVTIDGAGHMVPQDQPEIALDLLSRWLAGTAYD